MLLMQVSTTDFGMSRISALHDHKKWKCNTERWKRSAQVARLAKGAMSHIAKKRKRKENQRPWSKEAREEQSKHVQGNQTNCYIV